MLEVQVKQGALVDASNHGQIWGRRGGLVLFGDERGYGIGLWNATRRE